MKFAARKFIRNIAIALLTLMATVPALYAQRGDRGGGGGGGGDRGGGGREVRSAPVERSPAFVDRASHGSIRHLDTNLIQRPVPVQRPVAIRPNEAPRQRPLTATQNFGASQRAYFHRDVEADVNSPRNWDHFALGSRRHGLRPGYTRFLLNNLPYYYDDGLYYTQYGGVNQDNDGSPDADYQEVYPPVGGTIPVLPDGSVEIDAANATYYYADGAFYVQSNDGGFSIVPTPIGVVVPDVPPGAEQVSYNNGVAYKFNGAYYQPVFVNGVTQYETVAPTPPA